MPLPDDALEQISLHSGPLSPNNKPPTIHFAEGATAHRYPSKPGDTREVVHEHIDRDLGVKHEAEEGGSTYRDPYASPAYSADTRLRVPHSATLPHSLQSQDTLRTRLGRFQSTPDLSLQDPRASNEPPKKHKVKEFFQHNTGASKARSIRSQIHDGDESETEGLVTSPRNDYRQERNSMDEPFDSDASSLHSDDDIEHGQQPKRPV